MSIWKYKILDKKINKKFQLSLKEGNTPLEQYTIGDRKVFIKREDKNPNGSFKDRSLAFQISKYYEERHKKLIISSSGNAAISAAAYCNLAKIDLDIFVSNRIEKEKLNKLQNFNKNNTSKIKTVISKRPKSDAIKYSKKNNIPNLRGSIDDLAAVGFETISFELFKQNPQIDAIFIPCSSGTSTVGIYNGYKHISKSVPSLHVCQTEKIHPIAKEFDSNFTETQDSLAKAISDRVAHRKKSVINIIKETNGFGWVVSDKLLEESISMTKMLDIDNTSYNSHLSLAGYLKAIKKGQNFKTPCLIFSGL